MEEDRANDNQLFLLIPLFWEFYCIIHVISVDNSDSIALLIIIQTS
ncbi:MAG: hypothetical protein sGL2_09780 [Candidatus Mesenet longicola]|nr:MAG: hypothetical protein sGL2_09780 [Candidatus Mesenet longicola]